LMAGDMRTTQAVAAEGRELARSISDHLTSNQCGVNVACVHTVRGELDTAITLLRTTAKEARATRDLLSAMTCLMAESIALAFQGDSNGALTAVSAAMDGAPEIGDYFESACLPNVALAHLAAGSTSAAWAATEAAIPTIFQPYQVTLNSVWPIQAACANGEYATAIRLADRAISVTKGPWLSFTLTARARAKIACGESRSAEDNLRDALMLAAESALPLSMPDTLEVLAQLACEGESHQEAARLLGAAHALRQRMGTVRFKVYDAWYEAMAIDAHHAIGDNDFEAAWAEGAALSTDEAIAYAQRGRGERKRPSTGWGSLTPTELDVVRLVAEGIPNKDIATRLFVSPRTVQSHLRHVYNKLGLTSRVQLAQEAARH
jgi:DNA-binding CsgD family transcriptional regulator